MLLYMKTSREEILRVYLMLPYTKEHRLKRKKLCPQKLFCLYSIREGSKKGCTLYATDGTRLLISILKLLYICVHEENEEGYDSVPWGNSMCARKLCDVISASCAPFAISIALHSSWRFSLAVKRKDR